MSEFYITRDSFSSALNALVASNVHPRMLIFLAMKVAGVNELTFTRFESARDNRDAFFVPFLQVGVERTPRYFLLFKGEITPGGAGEYSHSSQYTPIRAGRESYIRDWCEWGDGKGFLVRFKRGYLSALPSKLLSNSKIPLFALSVYLQAMSGPLTAELSGKELVARWVSALHLGREELDSMFDESPNNGGLLFGAEMFSRNDAVNVILERYDQSRVKESSGVAERFSVNDVRLDDLVVDDVLENLLGSFLADVSDANFRFSPMIARRLVASALSKRFVIVTGLSGSGKTKAVQALARWFTRSRREGDNEDGLDQFFRLVPVGADWTGNENIFGFPDGLDSTHYVSKPALELILQCDSNCDVPHFLVLDEMNLSHVERYFADVLSMIESVEGVALYDGDLDNMDSWRQTGAGQRVPPRLGHLPENLFIIGTVNVDETTYMFSPKVLDRANVIEFRMDVGELEGFLGNLANPDLAKLDGKGAPFRKAFVDASKNPVSVRGNVKEAYGAEMVLLFKTLQAHGAEFGYRTAHEAARFVHFYEMLGKHLDGDSPWFPGAFDCVVFQKLLPKLHGSRAKLGPLLKKLWFLCVNDAVGRGADALNAVEEAARSTDKRAEPSVSVPAGAPYPLSAEKIGRMWRLLMENGFASFAEA